MTIDDDFDEDQEHLDDLRYRIKQYKSVPKEAREELVQHCFHSGASLANVVAAYNRGGFDEVVAHGSHVSMSLMGAT